MKHHPIESIVMAGLLCSAATAQEFASLPIRNRIQWLENNGYCGETSLQECALHFGIYASQRYIRGIYDPTQQNDLVELDKWAQVLATLGLKAVYFPSDKIAPPQYMAFEVWAKKQLALRHPVITTCYIAATPPGQNAGVVENDRPVDHIITLTGFTAKDLTTFSTADTFVFNHHLGQTTEGLPGAPAAFSQRVEWLFDTRDMKAGGATYGYAIQKEVDYAIAISGSIHDDKESCAVRLEVNGIMEPNLIIGEEPGIFKASVKVEGLTPGLNYVLYRYDDASAAAGDKSAVSRVPFKAAARVASFTDTIPSGGLAIYRCKRVARRVAR